MFSIFHRHFSQNNLHSTFLPPQNRRSAEQLNFCGFANRQKKAFRICYFLWYRTNTRKMSENWHSLVGFKSEDDDVRHFSSKEIQDFSDDHWNWGLVLGMSGIKFRSFLTPTHFFITCCFVSVCKKRVLTPTHDSFTGLMLCVGKKNFWHFFFFEIF